jgi:LPXTG-motif cell wall-anchored protein
MSENRRILLEMVGRSRERGFSRRRSGEGSLRRSIGVPGVVAGLICSGFLMTAPDAFGVTPPASPTLTATPSTNLVDGQQVELEGSAFGEDGEVAVAECKAGVTSESECDSSDIAIVSTDQSGSFSTPFAVARDISVNGDTIDCAQAGACVVAAGNLPSLSSGAATQIAFDPSVPPLVVGLPVPSVSPISQDGSLIVSGSVTCNESSSLSITTQMAQGPVESTGDATGVTCTTNPTTWSTSMRPTPTFSPGPAQLTVTASILNRQVASLHATVDLYGQSGAPAVNYYLALGDSLATGVGAPSGDGYVDDLLSHYDTGSSGLQLVDLGCAGETTTSFIKGPSCGDPDGSQLAAAESFLGAHASQVSFVTIDVGGDDIQSCESPKPPFTTDLKCVTNALSAIKSNLGQILAGLRAAGGPGLRIYAMNYFDPFVIDWLDGQAGQQAAEKSVDLLDQLNSELASLYSSQDVTVADVASAFEVSDFSDLVPTQWGLIPVSVDRACTWLDVGCNAGGPQVFGIHPNAAGYLVITATFEQLIGPPTGTGTTSSPQPATTSSGTAAPSTTPAGGSLPSTGLPAEQLALGALGLVLLGILLSRTRRRSGSPSSPS